MPIGAIHSAIDEVDELADHELAKVPGGSVP